MVYEFQCHVILEYHGITILSDACFMQEPRYFQIPSCILNKIPWYFLVVS